MRPYVHERSVEYWTSRCVESFFLDAGFVVMPFPLTPHLEKDIPADFVFVGTTKLFGFQYKALYANGKDRWLLHATQHKTLSAFKWIYYGLSDISRASQLRNALYYLRVLPVQFPFTPHIEVGNFLTATSRPYVRWSSFFESLHACKSGSRVENRTELADHLWPYTQRDLPHEVEIIQDVYVANLTQLRAIRFSSFVGGQGGVG